MGLAAGAFLALHHDAELIAQNALVFLLTVQNSLQSPTFFCRRYEAHSAQRYAPIAGGQRTDALPCEVRLRGSLVVVAHPGVVRITVWPQGKAVLGLPFARAIATDKGK